LLAEYLGDEEQSQFLGIHPLSELWVSPVRRTMLTMWPLSRTPLVRSHGPFSKLAEGEKREREVLRPVVKTEAFEEGGVYKAEFETIIDESGTERLKLKDYKAFPGLTREEMEKDFPSYQLPDDCTAKGWFTAKGQATGRESEIEARVRAKRFAVTLQQRAKDLPSNQNIAIVAHYAFLNNTLNALAHQFVAPSDPTHIPKIPNTDFDLSHWRHFNTAITVVDIDADTGAMLVICSNCAGHLRGRPDLMSGAPIFDSAL